MSLHLSEDFIKKLSHFLAFLSVIKIFKQIQKNLCSRMVPLVSLK